jgi:hypothetical protein
MIVEYKLNIDMFGNTYHPAYIKDHAYYDSTTKTFVGYILPESERDYWVPDTLVELTEEELVQRVLNGEISRQRMPGNITLTNEELEDEARSWYNKVR